MNVLPNGNPLTEALTDARSAHDAKVAQATARATTHASIVRALHDIVKPLLPALLDLRMRNAKEPHRTLREQATHNRSWHGAYATPPSAVSDEAISYFMLRDDGVQAVWHEWSTDVWNASIEVSPPTFWGQPGRGALIKVSLACSNRNVKTTEPLGFGLDAPPSQMVREWCRLIASRVDYTAGEA